MPEQDPKTPTVPEDLLYKSRLMDALYADPVYRPKLLSLIKEYAPHVRIPEIDTATEVDKQIQPTLKELENLKAEMTVERATRAAEKEEESLVQSGIVTADDLPEVKKLMGEKKIGDLQTAAEHFALQRKVAVPRTAPTPLRFPNFKGLFSNPVQWAREEAHKVLAETRR